MLFRAVLMAFSLSLAFLCGCATGKTYRHVDAPPPCHFTNGSRIAEESQWFCADVQDVIFGIDYNAHMENRFGGGGPYD